MHTVALQHCALAVMCCCMFSQGLWQLRILSCHSLKVHRLFSKVQVMHNTSVTKMSPWKKAQLMFWLFSHTYLWVLILTCTVLCLLFPPCAQFCNIQTCMWSMLLMLSLQCCDVALCCQELPNNAAPHHSTSDVRSPVLWCCAVLSGTAQQHSATSQHLRCRKSNALSDVFIWCTSS